MRKKGISTFKVAATYIGTIVGAGFATGQEVLQFFARFGIAGLLGIVLVTIMFIFFGHMIMDIGRKLNATSHLEIIQFSGGRILGTIIDGVIIFFLFGALTAMIAGTGALFTQQFQISSLLGNILMAVITAVTVLTGINGVINSISIVVPFLLVTVVGTSIYSVLYTPPDIHAVATISGDSGLITNWFLAAILYVSYNIIIAIAVLGPLGVRANSRNTIRNGAFLGGLGLGLGSVMIYLAISGNMAEIAGLEVPMMHIASGISPIVVIVYAVILIAAIYTTAVGSLYGFVSRITDIQRSPNKGRLLVIVTTIVALVASQFGFSNLVKYLYPLVGYGGTLLLLSLVVTKIRKRA
ncbi:hypothetical protein BHU72_05800 [Desulfuribacillus stibiiarsenatis]|uniref:Transporter n=1 Tax=Desulfuribacillus stibiiarsenatis TaxID=1390249 RepID=A0A1E5L5A4_9FIRM|nr:hypothetical protein [Desulfuribacillus stibiiarsenatis]OEH85244.1 hypothetical protein BHU72_05800 [Desulfuribacillus stibiiarsenatis]